jgi:hypothetical protein
LTVEIRGAGDVRNHYFIDSQLCVHGIYEEDEK